MDEQREDDATERIDEAQSQPDLEESKGEGRTEPVGGNEPGLEPGEQTGNLP